MKGGLKMEKRTCPRCGKEKVDGSFYKIPRGFGVVQAWCKGCVKEHLGVRPPSPWERARAKMDLTPTTRECHKVIPECAGCRYIEEREDGTYCKIFCRPGERWGDGRVCMMDVQSKGGAE
jgi:hypothetical protein